MIDFASLVRALVELKANPLGDGRQRVIRPISLHTIEVGSRNGGGCDCGDATPRQTTCKHELAARLLAGDAEVVAAVRGLFVTATNRRARLLSYVKQLRSEADAAGRSGHLPAAVLFRQVAGEIENILTSRGSGLPRGNGDSRGT